MVKSKFSTPSGFEAEGEKKSLAHGIFCDISGTLITYNEGSTNIRTVEDVLAFLRYARDVRQRPVTLCSRIQENALTPAALHEEFGFVVGKAVYRSQIIEVLIDNNPDEYLEAQHKFGPERLKGFASMSPQKQDQLYARLTGDTRDPPSQERHLESLDR